MSMNQIYKPRFPHDTQIDEKFNEFRAKVQHLFDQPLDNDDDLMAAMEFTGTYEAFQTIDDCISMDRLSHADDLRISNYDPANSVAKRKTPIVPPEALQLQTISTLVAQNDVFTQGHFMRYMKYNKHRHIVLDVDNSQPDMHAGAETLVVVRVYEPFK